MAGTSGGEKAYDDKLPRESLWRRLEKKELSVAYTRIIKDMYEEVKITVRSLGGIEGFPIDSGLYKG